MVHVCRDELRRFAEIPRCEEFVAGNFAAAKSDKTVTYFNHRRGRWRESWSVPFTKPPHVSSLT